MAAAPATVTVKSTAYDGQKGAWVERGICTILPAATGVITANLGLTCNVDQNLSCNIGDQVWVNARAGNTAGEIVGAAAVTAQGVVKVVLYNVTGTNITDSNAQTFDYMLLHYLN